MDLYRLCFESPIKRSYCPPHHGALERLNFQIILSLLKKSWNFASLLILLNHFAPALKVFALSEYMMFGFPLLEISFSKHLINSAVVRFDTRSRCTALLTLQENKKIYTLISFLPLDLQYNGPANRYLRSQMVRPVQFYLSVRSLG